MMIRNEEAESPKPDNVGEPSPTGELVKIINLLAAYWEDKGFGSKEDIFSLFQSMRQCPDDCTISFREELAEREAAALNGAPGIPTEEIQFAILDAGLAHCAEATRSGLSMNHQWWHVSCAQHYLGRLNGVIFGYATGEIAAVARRARLAADARHKENREMKKEAFEWLTENMERVGSMDAAAEAIAGNLLPVKFRAARDWVTEWKKLRSAGRL